jgi:purine-nucleoside/S-methyl-5'-thioadenosine phosphorylase / adenosine deaminase
VLIAPGLERRGVLAAFTERTGGISEGPFSSLNLGYRTDDDPARVEANRRRTVESLGVPPFAAARQVHGTGVLRIGPGRTGRGFLPSDRAPAADMLLARRPMTPLAVLVADCIPIVVASDDLVLAVHAGWRALASGILRKALGLFPDGRELAGAVGPAIGPCHYQVGDEVVAAVERGAGTAIRERRGGRWYLDLAGTAARVLRGAGLRDLEEAGECTACHPDRFFSHRRDGVTGRQAVIAMRM